MPAPEQLRDDPRIEGPQLKSQMRPHCSNPKGRFFALLAGLLFLTGCGEDFVVLQPVITADNAADNAADVPIFEGYYVEYSRKNLKNQKKKIAESAVVEIRKNNNALRSATPKYTLRLHSEDEIEVWTESIMLKPLYDDFFIAQVFIENNEANFAKIYEDQRLNSNTYYYLYLIRIFDTEEQGDFIYFFGITEDHYRILSVLADRYGAQLIAPEQPNTFAPDRYFLLGAPTAILKTLADAPHLDLQIIGRFRKTVLPQDGK